MKALYITAAILAIGLTPIDASAGSLKNSNTNTSQAQSQSGVYSRGDDNNVRSSSVAAPSSNSTAPCVISRSGGIGALGLGVAYGSGRIDDDCAAREDMLVIGAIAEARVHHDPAVRARAYAQTARMCQTPGLNTDTAIALGWCERR